MSPRERIERILRGERHARGKRLGVHMDGDLKRLRHAIAATKLDFIEAFTPPPDCDLSLAEARSLWQDKAMWINFTSSLHVADPDAIRAHTRQLLQEAGSLEGFAISITENVPDDVWQRSLPAILNTLYDTNVA